MNMLTLIKNPFYYIFRWYYGGMFILCNVHHVSCCALPLDPMTVGSIKVSYIIKLENLVSIDFNS